MALREVLIDELRDMYSAENQLVKALPKMAKGAKSAELKTLFTAHLAETKGQVERLKSVFEMLGKKATGQHCSGMEGVLKEGTEALEKETSGASFDSGLIGAGLRTEHYEIAGYTAAIAMAKVLGEKEIAGLLTENLNEELVAARKIFAAGQTILKASAKEPEAAKGSKSAKEKQSDKKSQQDEKQASAGMKQK